ncbi:hypothetical protein V6N11_073024 [Hibiscus sabdariffa]|uniref:Uncharacterized protein n=1 Tax=Hibiscus sabdariffa TaxID=183260 RepID=A0ABR2NWY7_9ROSI
MWLFLCIYCDEKGIIRSASTKPKGMVLDSVDNLIVESSNNGVEGKPVVARIALLDTRYLKYQDACIGTVEATMNNGLVMVTPFPNFTMALEDPNLMDALKVQIHIVGAQQVESSIIATLHYQIVYRVQDHAFRLGVDADLMIPFSSQ